MGQTQFQGIITDSLIKTYIKKEVNDNNDDANFT
jgi:hypothetical protein